MYYGYGRHANRSSVCDNPCAPGCIVRHFLGRMLRSETRELDPVSAGGRRAISPGSEVLRSLAASRFVRPVDLLRSDAREIRPVPNTRNLTEPAALPRQSASHDPDSLPAGSSPPAAARTHRFPRLLTIAGSDSGGGAGIQADLKTFAALGCYGMSAITALTAQNTMGVRAIHGVPLDILGAQIDAVVEDIGVDAIKIGMLHSADTVRAVASAIDRHRLARIPIVLDPVMVATSGAVLIDDAAIDVLVRDQIGRASCRERV